MEALFFNFSKRRNSTKVPEDSSGTSFELYLKQDTSLRNPTFVISADTFGFNYCKFNGAYYFVTDVISHKNNLWYVVCEIDDLATLRSEILASSAYVLYDTAANTELTDSRLSINTTPTYLTNQTKFTTLGNAQEYTAVVGVTGANKAGTSGSTGLFAMSLPTLRSLLRNMYQWYVSTGIPDPDWSWITDAKDALQELGDFFTVASRQFVTSNDVGGNIRSCTLIPVPLSSLQGTVYPIYLGTYETGISALLIDMDPFVDTCSIAIPWQATDWRRNAPYHEFYLNIPFMGTIQLSPSSLIGLTTLYLYMYVDVSDGSATIIIYKDFNARHVLGVYTANLGGNYLVGTSGVSTPRGLMAIAGAGASVITATAAMSAAPLMGVIPSIMNNVTPQSTALGGSGGLASIDLLRTEITLTSVFHNTNITPSSVSSVIGTPTMAIKTLSNVSGYVQTAGFSLQADAEAPALEAVNSFMNGGAFIE